MKRFFTKSVALFLLGTILGGLLSVHTAYAGSNPNLVGTDLSGGTASSSYSSNTGSFSFGKAADLGFGVGNFIVNGVALAGIATVLYLVYALASLILALLGLMFDGALNVSFYGLHNFFDNLGPVATIWTLIRDTVNVCFIFMLLYIAISMILGSIGVKAKSNLASVLISAIFVNFSMFFAKIIIDAGNIVAISIYNSLGGGNLGWSIAGQLMDGFNIGGVMSIFSISGQTNIMINLILHLVLVGIACYVFFKIAAIFIGRTVMLVIHVATSPVGFLRVGAIPWLDELRGKWWGSFVNQVMVAPLFMLLMLIFMRFLSVVNVAIHQSTSSMTFAEQAAPGIDFAGYLAYMMIAFLLWEGMKIVEKSSGKIGEITGSVLNTLTFAGIAAATGGVGMLGRAGGLVAGGLERAGLTKTAQAVGGFSKTLREVPSTASKFVKGEYKEKPGLVGFLGNKARDFGFSEIKKATGGVVSPKGIEDFIKKSKSGNEANVMKEMEKAGPQKDIDRQTQLKDIEQNITEQAKQRLTADFGFKDDQIKAANARQKEHDKNIVALNESQTKLQKATTDLASSIGSEESVTKAKKEYEQAQKNADISKGKLTTDMQAILTKQAEAKEAVAKELKVDLQGLKSEQEKLKQTIREKTAAKNVYISNVASYGPVRGMLSTGLTSKDRQKLVEKMRAQKGKYNADKENVAKNIVKALKDAGMGDALKEEGGGEKKEEKKGEEGKK